MPRTRAISVIAMSSLGAALAPRAGADEPFVDRPLTLHPLHSSAASGPNGAWERIISLGCSTP